MVKRGLSRDRLVAIAHEYVSANGLDALTMRRLAAAAEVTPGALYKHFRDQKDLRRAMADAIFAAIDLSGVDTDNPTGSHVITCCERMRHAMLSFRNGGRIVAGSYSPFAATLNLSSTLLRLLQPLTQPSFSAGGIAFVLRSYTVGFVIEEQAYLELTSTDEWDSLISAIASSEHPRVNETSDAISIMTGDRDERFTAGIAAIMSGTVRNRPAGRTRTRAVP